MARHFTRTASDWIDFSPGGIASSDAGPMSVAIIWRATSVHDGSLVYATNAGGFENNSLMPISDSKLWHQISGSFRSAQSYTTGVWRLDGWSKADGAAQQVRGHAYEFGGAWAHADYGACNDSGSTPVTNVRVGQKTGVGALNGDVAVVAMVGAQWSDANFETLTTSLADWVTLIGASSAVLWAFNQAAITDPVLDVLGGGGDQAGISGTSVTTDPPGFSYLLSTPTDCSFARSLPAMGGSFAVGSSSSGSFSVGLPEVTGHFLLGASITPPLMDGSASTRDMLGSATVV